MIKKNIKNIVIIFFVLAVGVLLFMATLAYQTFYSDRKLLAENVVFLSGPSATDLGYVMPKIEKNGIYGFTNVNYAINNTTNMTAYNVIMLKKLAPVTEYQLKVQFNSTIDEKAVSSFDVGVVNYPPQGTYDANLGTYITNITTKIYDKYKFSNLMAIDGFYKYLTEVLFNTNEDGQAWLVIGANALNDAPLKYNLGQLKIQTTELKNVYPLDAKSPNSQTK